MPSAIWTNKEKHTSTARATYQGWLLSTLPKANRKIASKKSAMNWAQMRPRNPKNLNMRSLEIPPKDRAKRFIRPKDPANAAASPAAIWKYVRKCVASWLFLGPYYKRRTTQSRQRFKHTESVFASRLHRELGSSVGGRMQRTF